MRSQNIGFSVSVAPTVPRSRRVNVKLKALMSLPLDQFIEVVFLLGSSEAFPENLGSFANPRLKLNGVLILLFVILFGGCRYSRFAILYKGI